MSGADKNRGPFIRALSLILIFFSTLFVNSSFTIELSQVLNVFLALGFPLKENRDEKSHHLLKVQDYRDF